MNEHSDRSIRPKIGQPETVRAQCSADTVEPTPQPQRRDATEAITEDMKVIARALMVYATWQQVNLLDKKPIL